MSNRMYRYDNEIDNDENPMNHYMHICTPMNQMPQEKQCSHDKHHHDHDEHHEHHMHEEDHQCYHHNDSMIFNEEYESMPMGENEHMPYGIHMHHDNMAEMPAESHAPMNNNMPKCGMPMMPMMFELEEDDNEDCDDKVSDALKKIEKRNPEILKLMAMHGIPYPSAKKLLKRIIKAVMHHK